MPKVRNAHTRAIIATMKFAKKSTPALTGRFLSAMSPAMHMPNKTSGIRLYQVICAALCIMLTNIAYICGMVYLRRREKYFPEFDCTIDYGGIGYTWFARNGQRGMPTMDDYEIIVTCQRFLFHTEIMVGVPEPSKNQCGWPNNTEEAFKILPYGHMIFHGRFEPRDLAQIFFLCRSRANALGITPKKAP